MRDKPVVILLLLGTVATFNLAYYDGRNPFISGGFFFAVPTAMVAALHWTGGLLRYFKNWRELVFRTVLVAAVAVIIGPWWLGGWETGGLGFELGALENIKGIASQQKVDALRATVAGKLAEPDAPLAGRLERWEVPSSFERKDFAHTRFAAYGHDKATGCTVIHVEWGRGFSNHFGLFITDPPNESYRPPPSGHAQWERFYRWLPGIWIRMETQGGPPAPRR
jgi:hypothetical protein